MESNSLFTMTGPIVINWIYIVTVALGAEVMLRVLPNRAFEKHKEYSVLLLAFIIAVFFQLLSDKPEDLGTTIKIWVVNYCIVTSLYELIIKKIKNSNFWQNDSSQQNGAEPNNL